MKLIDISSEFSSDDKCLWVCCSESTFIRNCHNGLEKQP